MSGECVWCVYCVGICRVCGVCGVEVGGVCVVWCGAVRAPGLGSRVSRGYSLEVDMSQALHTTQPGKPPDDHWSVMRKFIWTCQHTKQNSSG